MNNRRKIASVLLVVVCLLTSVVGAKDAQAGKREKSKPEMKYVPGRILVKFRETPSQMLSARAEGLMTAIGAFESSEIPNTGVRILQLQAGANEPALVDILRSQPDVEFAELDELLAPDAMVPNDPGYANEWHLDRIVAPEAWGTTTGLTNIVVAICDTGVDSTHPDLASKIVPGWNMYDNNADTSDVYGHGTMVAGTAAAASNNQQGVASVAWGCQLMPVRISDIYGIASYSTIANGIRWAADHGARVANVSYKASNSSSVTSASSYMNSKGGVVAIAAGNDGLFDATADNPYVLTVSATDFLDNLYSWSSRGNNIDVAAPGSVYTTARGGGYTYANGTSFAAPIVAGLAALVLSANPTLTATQAQDQVKQSADDLGDAGWDSNYGYGRVNAARAVGAGAPPDTEAPSVSFSSPATGANISATINVQVAASDNVGVASVSFSVDGVQQGTASASPYSFTWDSTTVTNGAHTLSATASDVAGNSSTATVTVNVNNVPPDTTPPTITITSPANNSRVNNSVYVAVRASDDVRVEKVELYVDGSFVASSTSSPFTTKWNAKRARSGAHTLQCKAYDAAGNVGVSSVVTVYR
ncbi:MAG: S8 family serine peptidase [Acidobacteriota bacterium]